MSYTKLLNYDQSDFKAVISKEAERGFGLYLILPSYFTKDFYSEHKKELNALFKIANYDFQLKQLGNGTLVLNELKQLIYANATSEQFKTSLLQDVSENLVVLGESSYLVHIYSGNTSKTLSYRTLFSVDAGSCLGFTVYPGHFADFDFWENISGTRIEGSSTDFSIVACLLTLLFYRNFLINVVGKFFDTEGKLRNPDDLRLYLERNPNAEYDMRLLVNKKIEHLDTLIHEYTSKNSSQRIDKMTINGESLYNYYVKLENGYFFESFIDYTSLLKMALILNKPVYQIRDYLLKTHETRKANRMNR